MLQLFAAVSRAQAILSVVPLREQVDQATSVVKLLAFVAADRQAARRVVFVAADYSSLVRLLVATVVDKRVAPLAVFVAAKHSHSTAAR